MSTTVAAGSTHPKAAVLTHEQINKLNADALSFFCHDGQVGRDNVMLFTFDALLAASNLLFDIAQYHTGVIRLWVSSLLRRQESLLMHVSATNSDAPRL